MADSKDITLKIDDRDVTVPPGTLVIEAARRMGIEVPSFCYFPGLSLQAACRMCLVEVEKAPKLQTACTLVAMPGMVVRTSTPQVHEARKGMLEFLLANHPLDCPVCDKGGECELQDMVFTYGADKSRFAEEKRHQPEQKWSEAVYYDAPRCILCFRCVRVCDEGMDVKALGVGQRGSQSVIIPNGEDHLDCEECGMCIDICPVGALTSGTYRYKTRPWEMTYVSTVCTHCSNGCKTTLSVRNNEILRANNRDLSGFNKDFLCVKGRFGFDFTKHPERLKLPLVRRDGKLVPSSWEDALAEVSRRLAEIHKASGADSIGFIGSNRTTNEENYLLGRIARASIGTNNIDHHRTADYASLIAALGAEGRCFACATMTQLYEADAVLLVGDDPTEQNPLVAWQIRSAIRHRGSRLYVINSKSIKLLRKASGFAEVPAGRRSRRPFAGLPAAKRSSMRERSSGSASLKAALEKENNVVIVFGAELTGAADPRSGEIRLFPSRPDALHGARRLREFARRFGHGAAPGMLPGYAAVDDANAREKFGALWGAKLPEKPGLDARGDARGRGQGKIARAVCRRRKSGKDFRRGRKRSPGQSSICSSSRICSSPRPRSSRTSSCPRPPPTRKTAR